MEKLFYLVLLLLAECFPGTVYPPPLTPVHPSPTIPVSTFTPAGVITFANGYEDGVVHQYPVAVNNWRMSLAQDPTRLTIVTTPRRKGQYALRVEVQPGDHLGQSGERAEVARMYGFDGTELVENESSGTQFYAFSVMLPADWQTSPDSSEKHWAIILQLHNPDKLIDSRGSGVSPAIAFEVRSFGENADRFSLDMTTGDLGRSGSIHNFYEFSDGSLNLGKWTDFVLKVTYAKDATGSMDVWRRNEGDVAFTNVLSLMNVPTLGYNSTLGDGSVGDHYWSAGFYRNANSLTNVLYLDGMTRGTDFDAVVAEAFPPVVNSTDTPTATSTTTIISSVTETPTATLSSETPTPTPTGTSLTSTGIVPSTYTETSTLASETASPTSTETAILTYPVVTPPEVTETSTPTSTPAYPLSTGVPTDPQTAEPSS